MQYRDFLFSRLQYYCAYRQHQSAAEIRVDKQIRTSVPHIFAIGDLAGPMLAHKPTHEAKVATKVAAGEESAFDSRAIPSIAYTDPETAWAGLTETDAKRGGVEHHKTQIRSASGRALVLGRPEGFTKMLVFVGDVVH